MSGDQKDPLTPKSTLIKIDLTVTYTSERRGKENINWSQQPKERKKCEWHFLTIRVSIVTIN